MILSDVNELLFEYVRNCGKSGEMLCVVPLQQRDGAHQHGPFCPWIPTAPVWAVACRTWCRNPSRGWVESAVLEITAHCSTSSQNAANITAGTWRSQVCRSSGIISFICYPLCLFITINAKTSETCYGMRTKQHTRYERQIKPVKANKPRVSRKKYHKHSHDI